MYIKLLRENLIKFLVTRDGVLIIGNEGLFIYSKFYIKLILDLRCFLFYYYSHRILWIPLYLLDNIYEIQKLKQYFTLFYLFSPILQNFKTHTI